MNTEINEELKTIYFKCHSNVFNNARDLGAIYDREKKSLYFQCGSEEEFNTKFKEILAYVPPEIPAHLVRSRHYFKSEFKDKVKLDAIGSKWDPTKRMCYYYGTKDDFEILFKAWI